MTEDELQQFENECQVQYRSTEDGDRYAIVDSDRADLTGWKVRVAPVHQRLEGPAGVKQLSEVVEFTLGDVGFFVKDGVWGSYGYGDAEWRYPWVASVNHGCKIVEWIPPAQPATRD